MAKETLILTPKGLSNSGVQPFLYSYYDYKKKEQVSLLTNGKVHIGPLSSNKDPNKNYEEKRVTFDALTTQYKLEYDNENTRDENFVEANFILRHPNLMVKGGEPSDNFKSDKPILWEVTLLTESVKSKYSHMNAVMEAYKLFNETDPKRWRELAFEFQLDPIGKGPTELASLLFDFQAGAVVVSKDSIDRFNKFMTEEDANDVKSIANKAIGLKFIVNDDGMFSYKKMALGRSISEVVSALRSDRTTISQLRVDLEGGDTDILEYEARIKEEFPNAYNEDGEWTKDLSSAEVKKAKIVKK